MKNSNIEWTDHTFNPWIGCTKVSAGCAHCYAEARDKRYDGGVHWGKGAERRRTTVANWGQPFKWDHEAKGVLELCRDLETPRPRVFCASLADVFDDEVPIEWLADLMDVIFLCQHLDWLLLTKRPQNIAPRLRAVARLNNTDTEQACLRSTRRRAAIGQWLNFDQPPPHVWLGTSVEDQAAADTRSPELLKIPATIRFLSCEPLLEAVDLGVDLGAINWVICGGESGSGARPMDEAWARGLRDQCVPHSTCFFMKQLGGSSDKRGRLEDLPQDLQLRAFP